MLKNMIKVLSLFDGISGAAQALKELGIKNEYYASEIDKFAIQITTKNHPHIKQIGDVNNIDFNQFKDIDLLIGGFPCQDLSIAKRDGKGLDGARSGLFSKCLEALEVCKPKYFLFENVNSMKKEWRDRISELLGVQPIMINSALVVAQMRKRLYWTNIPNVTQPDDKGIILKDILESDDTEKLKSYCIDAAYFKGADLKQYLLNCRRQKIFESIKLGHFNSGGQGDRVYSVQAKSVCLSANGGGKGTKTGLYQIDLPDGNYNIRKLTPIECERLQGFPDDYTDAVSNTQRYKALGNSFTVPVIKHILKNIIPQS